VIKAHLLVGRTPADPPPINDVLRAVFALLDGFAQQPAEQNAVPGTLCAPDADSSLWPAVDQANQLCELRRTLYVLVHQGEGIDLVHLVDPQVSGVIDYIVGTGKDMTPHYEVSGAVARLCSQNAQCQTSNGLELLAALSDDLNTPAGTKTVMDLQNVLHSATIQAFLGDGGVNVLTEDDAVNLAKVAIPAIENASPDDLQNLIEMPPLNKYQTQLQPLIDDMKLILMTPSLINPLKRTLSCLTWADSNYDLVRMLYRLMIRDQLPDFGVNRLSQLVDELHTLDSRGALVHLLGTVAWASLAVPTAVNSAASVCSTLFSTQPQEGQAKSNAQLGLPVVGQLFADGAVSEIVCALDTLIYGCAGGSQPACANPPPPIDAGPVQATAVCTAAGSACCTHCGSQQPCGDGCLAADATCDLEPGCACQ
jgi:hypothetical protein